MKVSRKIGVNKSRPRIWLEGKVLAAAGFKPKDQYNIEVKDDVRKMTLRKASDGKRKVSGKGDVAIVDILGKAIEEAFGEPLPAKVTVQTYNDMLTIVPEVKS